MNKGLVIAILCFALGACASDPGDSPYDDAAGFRGDDRSCTGTWGECVEDEITSGEDPGDPFIDPALE